ncbi:glycosyltransferase family 2 protein [Patescibacteria group bacterium]|nr:glycosyltransferase family 2 protein [Patescibacteria group bacterium]MBU4016911.1 glycosyltransferase family 2 protein [Patescibacteria group bacterium]MBU4098876.1 glycosyltransferase family 2 protein [Patescibacteria group bacterium]
MNRLSNPIISVIVPTKNSATTIESCLKSIHKQSYKNIEIIVVDNNSSDNTKTISRKYTDYVFNYGPERSSQRNFGAKYATGKFLLFIDSDMVLSIDVVKNCVKKTIIDQNIKSIIIPEKSFGKGFWAGCKKLEKSFYVGVDWIEAARFFEKKVFQEVGGYDEKIISGEDWDLSQKIGDKYKIDRISDFIYHNEGKISLLETIKKKFYYAKKFNIYTEKKENSKNLKKQTNILLRYKLYFSNPNKLFSNPATGIGMLFMKTCEFGFGGMGYLIGKRINNE